MYSVSPHTVQINGWISLAKGHSGFSHSLTRHEYVCDLIEHEIDCNGDTVHPDIVLTSEPEDHSVVAECKSEKLDEDQLERYTRLENNPSPLLQRSDLNSLIDSSNYELETCYSSLSDLSNRALLAKTETAFVHFSHSSSGVLIKNPISFDTPTIASTFPINMHPDETLPTEYYPFDIDQQDDREEFISSVVQALLHAAMVSDTTSAEEVVKEAHPQWDRIGDEKQSRFIAETEKILEILERKELQEYIENVADSEGEWKVSPKTAQAIQDRMEGTKFVQKIAEQAELGDF